MSGNIIEHALRQGLDIQAERRPELKIIPVAHLHVDPSYQRRSSEWKIAEMKKAWNDLAAGIIDVSYRDGRFWVFDGQHRLRVMQALSIRDALCLVHYDLSIEQEAALFVEKNSRRSTPKAAEVFRGRLLAGDPMAVAIRQVVDDLGFEIRYSQGEKKVSSIDAVGSLWRIASRYGITHLRHTLAALKLVWPDDPSSREGNLMMGMADFLQRYSDLVKFDLLADKLGVTPITQLRRMAAGVAQDRMASKVTAYSRVLHQLYNHKRKGSRMPLRY